ncbi:MAG: DUF3866 family protein [Armatimonadetes bacterium]|nr:DUF3866 family protein [Armatimonadota bacterium]
MLTRIKGVVKTIDGVRRGVCETTVDVAGETRRAVAYPDLTGPVRVGDEVLLNTTAVGKRLGTGGVDFVMANLSCPVDNGQQNEIGHIVKSRYTPVQHTVLTVEEEDSPDRSAIEEFQSLSGLPVVVGQLHSQLAPAAAAIKRRTQNRARVAYVMTDSSALPIAFSRIVSELLEKKIIDCTITAGQAFGGEYETVNIYTALIAAKEVANADAVVVCPGPGHVGTGTLLGFSAIEQGEIVNSINMLAGSAIAIARISYADPRKRHQGLSHHTLTALGMVALTKCTIALPMIDQMKLNMIQEQIAHSPIAYRHSVRVLDGSSGIMELQDKGVRMSSMGRSYEQDPEFFLSAAAAGALAAERINQP